MGYFANISGSLVIEHFTGDSTPTSSGNWISHLNPHVGPNFTYDSETEVFYPPEMYPSWTLDKTTQMWISPAAEPARSGSEVYQWNEDELRWDS